MTREIERIQNEIGINLINLVPVPWNKIGFRAICDDVFSTILYCFVESETGVVSSGDNANVRFKKEWYQSDPSVIKSNLLRLSSELYKEYEKVNSKGKMWNAFTYIINDDGNFDITFEYQTEKNFLLNEKEWRLKYFGETSLYYYKGLYPDTTDVII